MNAFYFVFDTPILEFFCLHGIAIFTQTEVARVCAGVILVIPLVAAKADFFVVR